MAEKAKVCATLFGSCLTFLNKARWNSCLVRRFYLNKTRGFMQKLSGKEIPRHQSRDLAAEEKQRNHKSVNFF